MFYYDDTTLWIGNFKRIIAVTDEDGFDQEWSVEFFSGLKIVVTGIDLNVEFYEKGQCSLTGNIIEIKLDTERGVLNDKN